MKQAPIYLKITGVSETKGNLMIAIFDAEEGFGNDEYAIQKIVHPVRKKIESIELNELVRGKNYAIAVYHDANNNLRMDKNFLGIPTEKYGFSNNARNTFGLPSFESASFTYGNSAKLLIEIK